MYQKIPKVKNHLDITQIITSTPKKENLLIKIDEKRDSSDDIINFINKKFVFKSKFDQKGSDEFLSSKDMALCDVILDEEIENDDEKEGYNNFSFMKNFSFNKENNPIDEEIDCQIKNTKYFHSNKCVFKSSKFNDNTNNYGAI